MIPLLSIANTGRYASLVLVVPGLRRHSLAGQPTVVFMAYPGRLS